MRDDEILDIYRTTIRPLYAYVSRRVGGDRALAEDLVQDTWMRALDTWPTRGRPDEPLAWLLRVARNTMISHFRRIRPESVDPRTIDLEAPGPLPDEPDIAATVSWGLARVRRRHADVIEAFYFDGKSVREIANERSTTEKAVEGRLRRARAVLKKKLEKLIRPQETAAPAIKERTVHERHT
jgi:RNA polymerase sigma-70 factor, ECF subfamily